MAPTGSVTDHPQDKMATTAVAYMEKNVRKLFDVFLASFNAL